ncbi:hypothetical protein GGR56DRAFT_496566 [Xylariaceae sp. FL0804]|nr:hypothetical protein GGR56DRAFT_496566 [Xylariaceae sp. FL0804]
MPIEFINHTTINQRHTRKLIRSQAAKGKNVGKTLNRRSRRPPPRPVAGGQPKPPTAELEDAEEPKTTIMRPICHGFSVYGLLAECSYTSLGLFHKVFTFVTGPLFPPELHRSINFKDTAKPFIGYAFRDEAFFHCMASIAVQAFAPHSATREMSAEALRHASRCMQLVNARLSDSREALSDPTLAVVVALTLNERAQGAHRSAAVHFRGVQRIIELRGGVAQLVRQAPALAQKVFRSDLEIALQRGAPTEYAVDVLPGRDAIARLLGRFAEETGRRRTRHPDGCAPADAVEDILEDVICFTSLVNGHWGSEAAMDGFIFHDVLIVTGYRLLRVGPLGGPRLPTWRANALQLGLIMYMTVFLTGLGLQRLPTPLLSRLVREVATQSPISEEKETQELLLWFLFTGRSSIFNQPAEDEWLVPRALDVVRRLGILCWDDLCRSLSEYPWVGALQGSAAQAFWQAVQRHELPSSQPPLWMDAL